MDPYISIVTLGVAGLERALRLYRDGPHWPLSSAGGGDVAFFRTGGVVLALYPRTLLAADAHVADVGSGFGGITLAHNVPSAEAVDRMLAEAVAAGATLLKPCGRGEWGGARGWLPGPGGWPGGGAPEPSPS